MRKESRQMSAEWAINPHVCLLAVTKCKPTIGPKDGSFTLEFQSSIAFGTAKIIENDTEK